MTEFILNNPNLLCTEQGTQSARLGSVSLRCPHCKLNGTFEDAKDTVGLAYAKSGVLHTGAKAARTYVAAIGQCPNNKCNGLVLIITQGGGVQYAMPAELIDIDTHNLPARLTKTLEEAVKCHAAGAYRAAAMMVRRLLEEICDENEADGKNLHERLQALRGKIILPDALFDVMAELKTLGNDAAHIEAKTYENIGKDEAEDSLELAKEILKALYQLQSLLDRLQARRKAV